MRLLGPVDVTVDGMARPVSGLRRKAVLAVLALRAGEIVSTDRLIEVVWGGTAPATALNTLQSHVSYLRRALGAKAAILARSPGYVLDLDGEATDVEVAERLIRQGTRSADRAQSVRHLQAALALWRGPPLVDVAGLAWFNDQTGRLDHLLLQAEQALVETRLALGEHAQLVPDLQRLAQQHPWHEHLHSQLMLALYRAGRQADALAVYQRLRRTLGEELGIDPSQPLRDLEAAILRQDAALAVPSCPARPLVPAQLPPGVSTFTGRHEELAHLDTLLPQPDQQTPTRPGTVVISAVSGTAGVGKTALAVHWAHRVAGQFADGQLYVNLRGFDPTGSVLDPVDAVRGFLGAFGVTAERIPAGLTAQAGLYRSLLAGKRVLVVLDNARDVEQVRPLLPSTPGCLAVVTSRHHLTGLAATEGAHLLALDLPTHAEAHDLLTSRLGTDRVRAEPQAVDDIVTRCARLPLALAIAAARAATHPGFDLQVLAKELGEEHTRLDALDTGEAATSMRAVFSWSYQALSPHTARLFRLLGLHPGPDITVPVASQLADMAPHQARGALRELTQAHLLAQHTPGRYAFHDLLRSYAIHLTATHDTEDDRHAAFTRLFEHYLHTAAAAMDTLRSARPSAPAAEAATARGWLETERANLTAIIAHTATHGWHTHTTQLANTVLLHYLELGVHYRDALGIYTHVHQAARHTNDRVTEALALSNIGLVHWQQGRYRQATDHHQQALAICRDIGDRSGEAYALSNLGLVHWQQGRYRQATDHHQQALAICRNIGFPLGEALALTNLGVVHCQQGRYHQAADHHHQALAICREIGFRFGEALALSNLGVVHCQQGRYPQATEHHQHALAIYRETGFPLGEALALSNLGLVHCQQGRYQQATEHYQHALAVCHDITFPFGEALALSRLGVACCQQGRHQQATDYHQQALALCRETGDRSSEARIRNGLGEAHHVSGQPDEARTQHTAALALATELGDRYEQAHAHHGLAHAHHATGTLDQAHRHRQQARTLYTDLGVPPPPTSVLPGERPTRGGG